jgi:uncharacterized protein (DUF2235 family)
MCGRLDSSAGRRERAMAGDTTADATFKPRNLVVLSDGTGNSSAQLFRTNVWRIYEALDLNCDDQVALYDNGVGTASFKPIAVLGGAFGYGLKRNVLELYTFLCRNYKTAEGYQYDPTSPSTDDCSRHDRIFAFGFSRGAFTARVVAGLVASQGLICAAKDDRDLTRLAKWAYRAYRIDRYRNSIGVRLLRNLRNGLLRLKDRLFRNAPYDSGKNRKVAIDFLGVFDTVAAYGLPVDELTRGWDKWVWPMMPRGNSLHERIKYGRHALAIDDERQTFFPILWDEDSDQERANRNTFDHPADRMKQVWFAGMHSNVGGGYGDDALSLTPLCWMAGEAAAHGLRFQPHMLDHDQPDERVPAEWRQRAAPCAPMGDSRHGVAAYYRYHPRPIGRLCGFKDHSTERNPKSSVTIDRPKIHESVFERIRDARDSYAPFALPETYAVVTRQGEVLAGDEGPARNVFEHSTQAASRVREQQGAWDAVWLRRVVYFATIATTLFLLALPLVPLPVVPAADASPNLKLAIGAIGGLVPGFAQSFLERYQDRPGWFVIAAGLVGGLLWCGSFLKGKVNDRMRTVWAARGGLQMKPLSDLAPEPRGWIYKLRQSAVYKGTFRFMSDTLWPNVFGVAIVLILVLAIPLRLAYQVVSRTDSFCKPGLETSAFKPLAVGVNGGHLNAAEFMFYPDDICRQSGLELKAGQKYAIQVAIPLHLVAPGEAEARSGTEETPACGITDPHNTTRVGGWMDATIPVVSTAGIESNGIMALLLPFRRVWGANWFVPIAAIGTKIPERHYLTDTAMDFTPTRTGRLSLYVNDAALPIGPVDDALCATTGFDCYYRNNSGGPAKVRVTELRANTPALSLPALEPYTCDEQRAMLAQ